MMMMTNAPRPLRVAAHVLFALAAVCIFAVVFGAVVMVAWNATLPELFGWPMLDFWQAVAILVMVRILTGRFTPRHHAWHRHHGHRHGQHRSRWCGGHGRSDSDLYDAWWHDEGEAAFRAYGQRLGNRDVP